MRTALLKRLRHPNCRAESTHRTGRGLRQTEVYLARLPRSPSALPVECKCPVLRQADTEGISDTYSMRTRVELCGNVQQRGLILTWFENRACLVHRRLERPLLPVRPAWRPVRTARQHTATARGPFRRPTPALPLSRSPVERRAEARPEPASDVAVNPCTPGHRRIGPHSAPGAPETTACGRTSTRDHAAEVMPHSPAQGPAAIVHSRLPTRRRAAAAPAALVHTSGVALRRLSRHLHDDRRCKHPPTAHER